MEALGGIRPSGELPSRRLPRMAEAVAVVEQREARRVVAVLVGKVPGEVQLV